jgi:hypothetical protein
MRKTSYRGRVRDIPEHFWLVLIKMVEVILLSFIHSFCSAGDQAPCLAHVRQALTGETHPSPKVIKNYSKNETRKIRGPIKEWRRVGRHDN